MSEPLTEADEAELRDHYRYGKRDGAIDVRLWWRDVHQLLSTLDAERKATVAATEASVAAHAAELRAKDERIAELDRSGTALALENVKLAVRAGMIDDIPRTLGATFGPCTAIEAAVLAEREACAVICDHASQVARRNNDHCECHTADVLAERIRERGAK